jgi:hypothetical protein
MKSRTLLVLAVTLFAFGALAAEAPPAAETAPPADEAPAMSVVEPVEPVPALDALGGNDPLFQQIKGCAHPNPGINCDNWDNAYCDYKWDCECCCAPVYVPPGISCPKVCV